MFWLGPERDSSIHRGLDLSLGPLEQADYIVCTGLFDDEIESAEDYRAMLLQARERQLTLICANPDIVVERGDRLIYCAGAIAELYRELGGEVIFYGKPHRPIYQRAIEQSQSRAPFTLKDLPAASALDALTAEGADRVLVLPAYPQYCGATTASTFDAVAAWATKIVGLSGLVIDSVPLVLRAESVSVSATVTGGITAASLVPVMLTVTLEVVPSAEVTAKVSV